MNGKYLNFRIEMKHWLTWLTVGIFFSLSVNKLNANESIPLEELVKNAQFETIKISPEGDKMGVILRQEGRRVLALLTLKPLNYTYVLKYTHNEEPGYFDWINNERVVVQVVKKRGYLDTPVNEGLIYSLNYDGSRKKTIFGHKAGNARADSKIKTSENFYGSATIIDMLNEEPRHILVSTHPWTLRGNTYYDDRQTYGKVLRLNVFNGKTRRVAKHPGKGGRAYTDGNGNLKFATGYTPEGDQELYIRKKDQWEKFKTFNNGSAYPVGFSNDGKIAYFRSNADGDRTALTQLKEGATEFEKIYEHKLVDIEEIIHYPGTLEPMAVRIEDGLPTYHYLDKKRGFTKFFRGIEKAFKNHRVALTSITSNAKYGVIAVSSDDLPVEYYLANLSTKKIDFLLSSRSWLRNKNLANTQPISFKASDGYELHGYLTIPYGVKDPSKLPTVVVPHGGPMLRDYWGYDRETQILANEGYLVLHLNFRGSSGYGKNHEVAAYGNWGSLVQKDIAEATKWIIEKGYADKDRVCIYGASFGGYSAMMNPVNNPGLYKCAAGFVGVYDLKMMYELGDIPTRTRGQHYLEQALGEDEQQLDEYSPAKQAHMLKLPIFLAHGARDERVPIEHMELLVSELKKNGIEVETHINKTGGHGFYTEKANLAYYGDLLKFLKKHLK